ncbi:hypothetical protein [Fimbriiglobus ruber]|uniref:Uncharacterized protein n=1 Tax=Fimbriiglobus ruber TaxID=1908690 RepID=A0A225E3T6_9BACT|nr:hypothetical protein [Fimbriiglobus ruber]OWK46424.1 hypothetical protein FRUB_00123 [Fimbriiglobus ruber]
MHFLIAATEWQQLRFALRAGRPVYGSELRLVPTRKTKDGMFLTNLVVRGLLETVDQVTGDPWATTYRLTAVGRYVADYGECDFDTGTNVCRLPVGISADKVGPTGRLDGTPKVLPVPGVYKKKTATK